MDSSLWTQIFLRTKMNSSSQWHEHRVGRKYLVPFGGPKTALQISLRTFWHLLELWLALPCRLPPRDRPSSSQGTLPSSRCGDKEKSPPQSLSSLGGTVLGVGVGGRGAAEASARARCPLSMEWTLPLALVATNKLELEHLCAKAGLPGLASTVLQYLTYSTSFSFSGPRRPCWQDSHLGRPCRDGTGSQQATSSPTVCLPCPRAPCM